MPTYKDGHDYNGGNDTLSFGYYKVHISHARTITKKVRGNPIIKDMVKLAETLPHGSGIDGNWTVQVRGNGNVVVEGEYHHMDENGFYDGWSGFKLHMSRLKKDVWNPLRGPCEGQVQRVHKKGDVIFRVTGGRSEDDRDYFHECLWEVMKLVEDWNNEKGERTFSREVALGLGWDGVDCD